MANPDTVPSPSSSRSVWLAALVLVSLTAGTWWYWTYRTIPNHDAEISAMRSESISSRIIAVAEGRDVAGRLAQFATIEGDVRVKRYGETVWRRADTRTVLRTGDRIKTSSRGAAAVLHFDGTVTSVGPSSLLEIRDP